jgi:hypothetical protein
MKRFATLFAAATLGLSLVASANDSDPGYGEHRWYGGHMYDLPTVGSTGLTPIYYRPTMRYYGNGFTVSYRYIPVYKQDSIYTGAVSGSSNFRTEAFHISTDEIPAWGANSPRLTVKDVRSAAPRTAITTIVRKKTTVKGGSRAPANGAPAEEPASSPTPESAPVQPKP